ncbi:MAG: mRNA surveillance protein pelota [Halobacteriaceae archaeon]
MRVQDRHPVDGGGERVTVVPESLDDLWHLHHLIEPGDLVAGDTTRRIQRGDDALRDTGGQREHVHVTLRVEDIEFAKFANRLRVSGVIESASREDVVGAHHTLNVEEREEIAIEKVWEPDQDERLADAVEASDQPDVAVATVEEGAAHVHTVAQYGIDEYASLSGTTGKGEYARDREELFDALGDVLSHLAVDAIILAGPGFTKQDAYDYLAEEYPSVAEKITVVDTSAVGGRGVHEVLKRGAIADVRAEARVADEAALIDELTGRMRDGHEAAYGIDAVAEAVEFGAVDTLLILDERLRQERSGEGDWEQDVDALLRSVEQQGGDVVVFSAGFEPGQQLRNLGGIAALLRYRVE